MVQEFCSRLIRGWMKIGHLIGDFIARVALLAIFGLTVVPIGIIWKFIKNDPMKRAWDEESASYFEDSDPIDPKHWRRMF